MLATWSSSLALCISISAHHIGGRPAKTFESEQAVHQYPPKHLKSSVDQGIKGEKTAKIGNYGGGKAAWKCLWCVYLCLLVREKMLNGGRQQDVSRLGSETHWRSEMNGAARSDGKEMLWGLRRDGWMMGSGMLCHPPERAVWLQQDTRFRSSQVLTDE